MFICLVINEVISTQLYFDHYLICIMTYLIFLTLSIVVKSLVDIESVLETLFEKSSISKANSHKGQEKVQELVWNPVYLSDMDGNIYWFLRFIARS